MACLMSNMGHIIVIHNNFNFTSDVILYNFCYIVYLRDATKRKTQFLEIKKNVGKPFLLGAQLFLD